MYYSLPRLPTAQPYASWHPEEPWYKNGCSCILWVEASGGLLGGREHSFAIRYSLCNGASPVCVNCWRRLKNPHIRLLSPALRIGSYQFHPSSGPGLPCPTLSLPSQAQNRLPHTFPPPSASCCLPFHHWSLGVPLQGSWGGADPPCWCCLLWGHHKCAVQNVCDAQNWQYMDSAGTTSHRTGTPNEFIAEASFELRKSWFIAQPFIHTTPPQFCDELWAAECLIWVCNSAFSHKIWLDSKWWMCMYELAQ